MKTLVFVLKRSMIDFFSAEYAKKGRLIAEFIFNEFKKIEAAHYHLNTFNVVYDDKTEINEDLILTCACASILSREFACEVELDVWDDSDLAFLLAQDLEHAKRLFPKHFSVNLFGQA